MGHMHPRRKNRAASTQTGSRSRFMIYYENMTFFGPSFQSGAAVIKCIATKLCRNVVLGHSSRIKNKRLNRISITSSRPDLIILKKKTIYFSPSFKKRAAVLKATTTKLGRNVALVHSFRKNQTEVKSEQYVVI